MGRFVYGTVRSSLPKGLTPNANSIRGKGGGAWRGQHASEGSGGRERERVGVKGNVVTVSRTINL